MIRVIISAILLVTTCGCIVLLATLTANYAVIHLGFAVCSLIAISFAHHSTKLPQLHQFADMMRTCPADIAFMIVLGPVAFSVAIAVCLLEWKAYRETKGYWFPTKTNRMKELHYILSEN